MLAYSVANSKDFSVDIGNLGLGSRIVPNLHQKLAKSVVVQAMEFFFNYDAVIIRYCFFFDYYIYIIINRLYKSISIFLMTLTCCITNFHLIKKSK